MKNVFFSIILFSFGVLVGEISNTVLQGAQAQDTDKTMNNDITIAEAERGLLFPIRIIVGDAALTMGKTGHPGDYGYPNSVYLVMDKATLGDDATILLREAGNARAEIGLEGNNDIHFKTVTGTYLSEVFTDRFLIRATGEVDSFGTIMRQYAASGTPVFAVGDTDGVSAGSGIEIAYDHNTDIASITSIERGNSYHPLNMAAFSHSWFVGFEQLGDSPAMALLHEGTLQVYGGIQISSNGTHSGGQFEQGALYKDAADGLVVAPISGTENDFLLTTTVGDNIMRVPNGTNDVEFAGGLKTLEVVEVGRYTVATLPPAVAGGVIYVSDGAAGRPALAFSDGTRWLRSDTLAPVAAR